MTTSSRALSFRALSSRTLSSASLALAAFTLLGAAPASAEATAEQRAACTADVWRLCASEIPNVDGIKACLRRESPRLSTGCRSVMQAADRGVQTASAKGQTPASAPTRN